MRIYVNMRSEVQEPVAVVPVFQEVTIIFKSLQGHGNATVLKILEGEMGVQMICTRAPSVYPAPANTGMSCIDFSKDGQWCGNKRDGQYEVASYYPHHNHVVTDNDLGAIRELICDRQYADAINRIDKIRKGG